MGSLLGLLLWAWIILESGPGLCSVPLPDITDRKFIDECVEEHNKARSSVNPPAGDMLYMTWDEGLARVARAWARNCLFQHNTHLRDEDIHPDFSPVGENIWAGAPPSSFSVTKAMKRWVDERQYYNYNSNSCFKVCGHYTQVVWASSFKVGCAVQICPNGVKDTAFASEAGAIFVCNYAKAGNVNGQRPYKQIPDPGCSQCDGSCVNNLCRNPERDAEKRYGGWTPAWDSALASNAPGSNYVSILLTRPIALLFTFITAYIVHHFYPQAFCYE